ncbi:hypothetical protein, partial [Desulfovibrio sp.]
GSSSASLLSGGCHEHWHLLKWEQALAKVMQNKELLDKMHAAGFTPAFLNGKEYREFSRNSTIAVQEMLKYNKQGSKK